MTIEKQLIGEGPFFTYLSGNGKYGLSAESNAKFQTVGLETGAIFETPESAISAALARTTRVAHNWQRRALEAEQELEDLRPRLFRIIAARMAFKRAQRAYMAAPARSTATALGRADYALCAALRGLPVESV